MTIRALVIDDEPLARKALLRLLKNEPDINVIGQCSDGEAAVETIRRTNPDLVFLDVQMPEMDGFRVVETIGADQMPVTIFVTAYDKYALEAFDANAVDYLLKPFAPDRLGRIFDDFYTTKEGGTGLGLSIVRRLVMDLHGTIGVNSAPGRGTCIIIDIPADGPSTSFRRGPKRT